MSQILIIDLQKTYEEFYPEWLPQEIKQSAEKFSQKIYLFDSINGETVDETIPYDLLEDEEFYDSLNVIEKQYGFFRGLMDYGIDEEDIVNLGKFMISHSIWDWRYIDEESEDIKEKFLKKFKNTDLLNLYQDNREGYSFYIPDDLLENLKTYIKNGVTLVGGGRTECLQEISLFLDIIDIEHTINEALTY